MVWQKVAEKDSIEKGKGIEVRIGEKRIAIFNQDGYHGIDALCVHQDGSIVPGKLNGCVVECPLHFWHYDIKTGAFGLPKRRKAPDIQGRVQKRRHLHGSLDTIFNQ